MFRKSVQEVIKVLKTLSKAHLFYTEIICYLRNHFFKIVIKYTLYSDMKSNETIIENKI